MSDPAEQDAPRRHKPLACKRCRHRKQKCTEVRPCDNCTQSGSECIPTISAPTRPPLEADYVQRLEERVAQLEALIPQERLDHIDAAQQRDQLRSDSKSELRSSHDASHSYQAANQLESPLQYETGKFGAAVPWEATPAAKGPTDIFGALSGIYSPQLQMGHDEAVREVPDLDPETERSLTQTYFDMAHSQYPFLLKHEFLQWAESWRTARDSLTSTCHWKGFFVHMVYSIAFLMTKTRPNGLTKSQALYTLATSRYLPYIVQSPDLILRAQGFLLLTIYALHMPSHESIIALSSSTYTFNIEGGFSGVRMELIEQSAAHMTFHTRFQIITLRCKQFFDNIGDDQLLTVASNSHATSQLLDYSSPTSVSAALHVLKSRMLESEIQETLLSKDFVADSNPADVWRMSIMHKLNAWDNHSEALSEPSRKGYVSPGWLKMIYYYNLIMLYRPTRMTAKGLTGDLSLQACCQALLMFRKFQMAREIAKPWLGLLTQFQIGVNLLYCFYATPILHWKESYKSVDVSDAIRACSSTLAILSERWVEAECVRDVFEILAREIPIGQTWERPTAIRQAGRTGIEENWNNMSKIVIHRPTLRMIHEMATKEFVRDDTGDIADGAIHPSIVADGSSAEAANLMHGMDLQWVDSTNPALNMYNNFESTTNIGAISDHGYY
ncbi:putative Fungal-specific transcription factor domain-containing protein [Seiridium cardinale]|uniref:Fungal-specific transcription factor domain-containing protein n=1 Tax=Seiridium cardinale TaxID=138064 RepID=A0ABR2XCZ6_9PEZI